MSYEGYGKGTVQKITTVVCTAPTSSFTLSCIVVSFYGNSSSVLVSTQLKQAGELLGLRVLDHIIIGEDRYVSLADQGHA